MSAPASLIKPPRRILVIQLRRIGDAILTTPALALLRKRFPKAKLDFLLEPPAAEALEGNPDCRVLVYAPRGLREQAHWLLRLRAEGYDWCVDYLGNPRSALLTWATAASVRAGPAHVFHKWAYNHPLAQSSVTHYAGQEKIRVLRHLGVDIEGADFLPKLYLAKRGRPENEVGIVPASRRQTRRWPAQSFARVGKMIRDKYGAKIVVFWGPGEKALAYEVAAGIGPNAEITPETKTLKEAAALMTRCRLILTNCNGPKHLAVGLGVATVTVHQSSDPASWNPPHPRHLTVRRADLPCIGCGLNDCPYNLECRDLSPEAVFAVCARLLEAPREALA